MKHKPNKNSDSETGFPEPSWESSTNLIFENLKWLTSRETVMYLRLPSAHSLIASFTH